MKVMAAVVGFLLVGAASVLLWVQASAPTPRDGPGRADRERDHGARGPEHLDQLVDDVDHVEELLLEELVVEELVVEELDEAHVLDDPHPGAHDDRTAPAAHRRPEPEDL